MKVAVAVLSYNRLGLWTRTLDSLKRTDYPFEMVLYDNGSTDGTAEKVAALGGICNQTDNHWIGHGFRECTRLALEHEPDLILLSGDDYEYKEGWLEKLVAFWEAAPADVALCSCHIYEVFRWNAILGAETFGQQRALRRQTLAGDNWSFRSALWSEIEMLIPDDGHKYDKDVSRTLTRRGCKLYELDLATHIGAGHRIWTHAPVAVGKPVDRAAWGLE